MVTSAASDPQILGLQISPWILAPVLFLLWTTVVLLLWKFLHRWLVRRAEKSGSGLLSAVVQTLGIPLTIVTVVVGLWGLAVLLPLPTQVDNVVSVAARVLVLLAVLVFLDRFIYRLLVHFKGRFAYIDITRGIVRGMLRLLIAAIGLLLLLEALHISITPILASLGIGSLAVALALQEPLSNLFAGLFVLADRTVRVGDFVKLDTGEEGYVTHIGWRHTRVRTVSNIAVIVPNSRLNTSVIQNLNLPQEEVSIYFPVGVSYSSDLRRVEAVTLDVARRVQQGVPGAVRTFEPFVRYHTFDNSSINFNIALRAVDFGSTYMVKHEFIKALHERYQQEGIVIPFPMRTLDIPPAAAAALHAAGMSGGQPLSDRTVVS
ncbi:mechanosensitive ion channel [candidate division WOR-3 bacterium]|nr:mechanosensitive ion channel [candidate division WOR-3 bacterium]